MTRPWPCKPPVRRLFHCKYPLATLFLYAWALAWDATGLLRLGLACALLHEAGHIAAYRRLLRRWPCVVLSPLGLRIPLRGLLLPARAELVLAAAGPLVNLLLCCAAFGWMRWQGPSYAGYGFAAANLLTGCFNLLPLPGLDGARILACLLARD